MNEEFEETKALLDLEIKALTFLSKDFFMEDSDACKAVQMFVSSKEIIPLSSCILEILKSKPTESDTDWPLKKHDH